MFQHFEANLHNFESSVSFMDDNLRDLDLLIRSKKHLNENLQTLEVIRVQIFTIKIIILRNFYEKILIMYLTFFFFHHQGYLKEAEGFSNFYDETVESSKHIFAFLDENSEDGSAILQNHLRSVHLIYNT